MLKGHNQNCQRHIVRVGIQIPNTKGNVGAFIIRIGFRAPLFYSFHKEP